MRFFKLLLPAFFATATLASTNSTSSESSQWDEANDSSNDGKVIQVTEPETGVFVVTMNQPDNHNTMTPLMMGAVARAVDRLSAMDAENITTIILAASGKSFSAGVDINAIRDDKNFETYWTRDVDPFLAIQQSRIPVISLVRGAALTGGFELAISADIVLASKDAIFRDNHAMYGVLQLRGLSQIVSRIAGPSNARLASLASFPITAERALSWHIVSEVVDTPDDLLPAALEIAKGLAYNSGPVQRALKRSLTFGYRLSYAEAREHELAIDTQYFETIADERDEILTKGAARFNERVAELNGTKMGGGMADGDY